jgi:hypothetical protein
MTEFLAYFSKVGFKRSPYCLCVCESHSTPINFRIPEPVFIKLDIYIMAPEPISTAYFLNPSHKCVSVYVFRYRC